MKNQITILIGITFLIILGCHSPDRETAEAWKTNMGEGIVPDYSEFVAHWVDSDIAAYIFSYICPKASPSGKDLFAILQKQIPDFVLEEQNDITLILRHPISYSGPGGFDEWRFIYDKETRVMSVLFANLDSEVERKFHRNLVEKLKYYHDEKVGKKQKS